MKRKTKKDHAPNARFWFGRVKVTLAPGEMVHFNGGRGTEEGFHSWEESLYYDPVQKRVFHVHDDWGSDCDGRYSHHDERSCAIENLDDIWNEYIEQYQPAWEHGRGWQRDYTAEAAGY